MALNFDPRSVDLERFLRSLEPRAELVRRLALRGLSTHCRGDRAFNSRTEELQARVDPDGSWLAALLRESDRVSAQLAADLAASSVRGRARR